MARNVPPLPLPVRRAVRQLGSDLRAARRRRRIPVALLAQRALISETTLRKVERGDPAVSLGIYATVLFVLGLADRLSGLAAAHADSVGLALDEERLPQRIRRRRVEQTSKEPEIAPTTALAPPPSRKKKS
jgi:hypothetical protein